MGDVISKIKSKAIYLPFTSQLQCPHKKLLVPLGTVVKYAFHWVIIINERYCISGCSLSLLCFKTRTRVIEHPVFYFIIRNDKMYNYICELSVTLEHSQTV